MSFRLSTLYRKFYCMHQPLSLSPHNDQWVMWSHSTCWLRVSTEVGGSSRPAICSPNSAHPAMPLPISSKPPSVWTLTSNAHCVLYVVVLVTNAHLQCIAGREERKYILLGGGRDQGGRHTGTLTNAHMHTHSV